MRGFLLDTNILSYAHNEAYAEHRRVTSKLLGLASAEPRPPLFVSAITIGEIEYGHRVNSAEKTEQHTDFERSVKENFFALPVTSTTGEPYGVIRSALFNKFAPGRRKGQTRWVEQLIDPETALALGIQENDVWIAAQALEHNLVLVTHDDMSRIRDAAGPALTIEDWAASP